MNGRDSDIAIVGGGLAGGLIAAALVRERPDLSLALIEAGETLGGNHRWSWFASDLSSEAAALMESFAHTKWDGGYDVAFPGHARHLSTPYRSLASSDFDAGLRALLPEGTIRPGRHAVTIDATGAILDNGERIAARAVLDCRGLHGFSGLECGWQLFYGRHIRTDTRHGVDHPVIMEASVHQHGAYRFIYLLPIAPDELFVEDTYYADSPALDRATLSARVDSWCRSHEFEGETLGEEAGVLPVVTGGDFGTFQAERRIEGVGRAGVRGGFMHPLTSYTLPFAAETALAVAKAPDLSGPALARMLEEQARRLWQATGFYRLLGRMLFGAAEPEERWRIFEHFYRLPEDLIERFYAGRSTAFDKARILVGKPPVKVRRAIGALLGERPHPQQEPA